MPNQQQPATILLMTTAPPENSAWYHGKRLPPIGLMYVAAALGKSRLPSADAGQLFAE